MAHFGAFKLLVVLIAPSRAARAASDSDMTADSDKAADSDTAADSNTAGDSDTAAELDTAVDSDTAAGSADSDRVPTQIRLLTRIGPLPDAVWRVSAEPGLWLLERTPQSTAVATAKDMLWRLRKGCCGCCTERTVWRL